MNVKITETAVIFKISEDEMHHLLSRKPLEKILPIASNEFAMVIDPRDTEKDSPLILVLDKDESCIMLRTSHRHIEKLAAMGRNRHGLTHEQDGISVTLQVDLRQDSRKRKAAPA